MVVAEQLVAVAQLAVVAVARAEVAAKAS